MGLSLSHNHYRDGDGSKHCAPVRILNTSKDENSCTTIPAAAKNFCTVELQLVSLYFN
jgi:hypothetical protein